MSVIDEIKEGIGNVKGWIEDVEGKLPAAAAAAERYESSPIVQALEAAVLPPEVETALANIIKHFADQAAAPAADTTAAPAAATAA